MLVERKNRHSLRGFEMNLLLKTFPAFLFATFLIISLSCTSSTPNVDTSLLNGNETDAIVNNYFPEGLIIEKTDTESGILVVGEGSMKIEPDIAILNMGIQVERPTASHAR